MRPISLMSASDPRRRNEDPRAVTNSHRRRDSSVISSWAGRLQWPDVIPRLRLGGTAAPRWTAGKYGQPMNGRLPASLVCYCSPRDFRVRYEAEALTMDRLDELLGLAVIAESLARRLDPACHRRLGDNAPIPHLFDDLVLDTRRSRLSTSNASNANTCGSTEQISPPERSSTLAVSSSNEPNR